MARLIRRHGDYARIASSNKLMKYFLGIPFEVELEEKVLMRELDLALSDMYIHAENIYIQNKKTALRLIGDSKVPIENNVPSHVYKYPPSELVFSIKNRELRCHTRLDLENIFPSTDPVIHAKLLTTDTLSPLSMKDCKETRLKMTDILTLISSPKYYNSQIMDMFKEHDIMESISKPEQKPPSPSAYCNKTDSNYDIVVNKGATISDCPLPIEDVD